MKFRPTAIPLVTVDPYFSIWSFSDNLYSDVTRHWTGQRNAMLGLVKIDNIPYKFMGMACPTNETYVVEPDVIQQTCVTVKPLTTTYIFENDIIVLTLSFLTPLLVQELHILSRPASYIYYDVKFKDNKQHAIELYFEISGDACVDTFDQEILFFKKKGQVYCGCENQGILNKSGDNTRIDWGYLHLAHENAFISKYSNRYEFLKNKSITDAEIKEPVSARKFYGLATTSKKISDMICIAYDDIKSIEYFNEKLDAYYKIKYKTFENMLDCAISDFEVVKEKSKLFEEKLKSMTDKISAEYSDITALSFRQVIAAHKLVHQNGVALFLSKECFSNGCIATLDVTYPSIPLFLKFNTELVKGMMRPIFKYANSKQWTFEFAPHDCGQYPLCNGQVYGDNDLKMQMPVEECGNALITVSAIAHYDNDDSYIKENKELLDKWANYILENGYDPGNQLCTDDFAGHLARNCNLSAKAIVALAAYGKASNQEKYYKAAKDMALSWENDAKLDKGSKLAFDQEHSWSLKYNLVWDSLLNLNLFNDEIYKSEIELYKTKMNKYGVPLDSRSDYTKIDWLAWTTVLTDDKEYTKYLYHALWLFINQSPQRVPITDWFYSSDAQQVIYTSPNIGFQNRSVLGGIFINLL